MSTPWPLLALIGLLGLAIGSFLNVVVYRVPRDESLLFPSSRCPNCSAAIKARHNVPVVGWLMLRGRCASCKARISMRYPIVEGGTAVLFVAITLRFGLSAQLPAYLYLSAIGVTLALIDFDVRRLPDSIVLPSYVVSVLLLMPAGAVDADWSSAQRAMFAMGALLTVYFALAIAYPHGVEFSDVKLAGLLGLHLGWLSWSTVVIGGFGGFVIGGVGGTAALATRRIDRGVIPFAPCMIAASVLAFFITVPISSWYTSMLGVA
jgi:leader peptidase (prepilin peptidase) / N-methyltransferase